MAPKAAELACTGVLRAFDKLAELCDSGGPGALKRLGVQYERLQAREWATLESALGVTLPRAPAPAGAADLEDWEDFVAAAVTPLNALGQALERLVLSERSAE